ncbi:discoidin domain-containing protein [Streptomyces sp. NPDC006332]|uniref:discoidin domain-containing protein n=1 Tax=Streptomyces sp. NPDC006332 TaxID=3155456 RepID=UPI0033B5DD27
MRPLDTEPPPRDRRSAPTRRRFSARALRTGISTLFTALVAALLVGSLVPAAHAAALPDPAAAPAVPAASVAKPDWPGNTPNSTGGKDYFIDATHGSDAAAGTSPKTAWRTLAKANATTFKPGDRILLKAGEQWQDEQLWPKGSGSAGHPITISAYGAPGAGRPYIATNGHVPSPFNADGTKNPATVGLTGAIVLRNQQNWEINNVELSNDDDFSTDITKEAGNVRDGISVSVNADLLKPGDDSIMDHFRISDVYVHNTDGPSYWQKIYYAGVDFQVFGNKDYKSYSPGGYYFKDVRIENNTFEKVELNSIQFGFNWMDANGADDGQYDDNGKWHEGWEQLWIRTRDMYSRDVYIGHNYTESSGQGAIQLGDTKNMKVEYNEVNGYLKRYDAVSCALYLWAGADTVMQYNEVYDGPSDQFDGTPWDLEYTNFNVTYQFNYSHDNPSGWMAYMGNSSGSVARYNLSVNDNGVLVKNMLSTNYSPTYFTNNTFVYDGSKLSDVHDETFLSRVYFLNNIFYNTSKTTTTPWYQRTGALRQAVFSNNDYYERSGIHSTQEPADPRGLRADPRFVGDPADYVTGAGVERIRKAAEPFALRPDSPLIDAGRYNPHLGNEDFLGTHIYYGTAPDIGMAERRVGLPVLNPVDTDPIEKEADNRVDLALHKPVTASSTHSGANGTLTADKLTDGDLTTRWAAADDATYPITLDIDFGADTTFDQVYLDEYTDSGTNPRVQSFELQRWDPATGQWVTFASRDNGIGHDLTVTGFGSVTTSRLRVALTGQIATEQYTPTLTEIAAYHTGA